MWSIELPRLVQIKIIIFVFYIYLHIHSTQLDGLAASCEHQMAGPVEVSFRGRPPDARRRAQATLMHHLLLLAQTRGGRQETKRDFIRECAKWKGNRARSARVRRLPSVSFVQRQRTMLNWVVWLSNDVVLRCSRRWNKSALKGVTHRERPTGVVRPRAKS